MKYLKEAFLIWLMAPGGLSQSHSTTEVQLVGEQQPAGRF